MKWLKTGMLVISLLLVLMQGCKKDVDENPAAPENTKENLNEEIDKVSGINEYIHSSYFSELNSYYYAAFSVDISLQSPEKRTLIKKIMIMDQTNGQGWEFYDKDLPKYYVDSLKGYRFPHLIFTNSSAYGMPFYDRFFKIKLYGYDNSTSNDYEFILKANTISLPQMILTDWFDKSVMSITSYGCTKLPKEVKVNWMQNGSIIAQSTTTNKILPSSIYSSSIMISTVGDVPDNADSYFLSISDEKAGGSKSLFISYPNLIPSRLPSQAVLLPDGITIDRAILAKSVNKIILINSTGKKLYVMNFDNSTIEKTVDLPSSPVSGAIDYSADSNKVYFGTKAGAVYSYSLDQNSFDLVYNTGSEVYGLVLADKTLLISSYNNLLSLRLDTRQTSNFSGYIYTDLVYNKFNYAVYCRSNSSSYYLYRIDINPLTGMVSGANNSRYYSSYPIGSPIKIFPDGSASINGAGTIFSCTSSVNTDMTYLGTIAPEGYTVAFTDLVFSPDNAKFMTIIAGQNSSGQLAGRLQVFNAKTFQEDKRLSLPGSPKYIFNSNDKLLILSYLSNSGRYFAQPMFYSGLIQNSSPAGFKSQKEHFFSKKL